MTDINREQFETWAESQGIDIKDSIIEGCYAEVEGQLAWDAWQASRSVLAVELPQQSGANISWNQAIQYCHLAIEAVGVRVKP